MKITIELNEDESKRDSVTRFFKGQDALSALFDLAEYLRQHSKYPEEDPKTIHDVKDDFWEILKDYDLKFEDLG